MDNCLNQESKINTETIQRKKCSSCKKELTTLDFTKDKSRKSGLKYICKLCASSFAKSWNDNNKKRRSITYKEWTKHNKEHRAAYRVLKKYGLSSELWIEMKKSQDYCCAICGIHESKMGKRGLVVDHNHKTGTIRALLCNPCNMAIGQMKENIETFKNAVKYLEKFNKGGLK